MASPPSSYCRAASLIVDIGEPEFPFRLSVEISATDLRLTAMEQQTVQEHMAPEELSAAALEALAGGSPTPEGGAAAWYRGSNATGALAALCNYSVPSKEAGFLLGFLTSSQVCVPLLDSPTSDWPTLKEALQMASAIALVPTSGAYLGQPAWSLVAYRPAMQFLVRTVKAEDRSVSLAEDLAQQIRGAFGV
ncbi:hypothetical protein [Streptomyces litmocidini]|uniref:Uncharacterized protein n=1 Tax=Streptomyces litmocidini TaxID=67318 RepID=A0ABW7U421_9ACTN